MKLPDPLTLCKTQWLTASKEERGHAVDGCETRPRAGLVQPQRATPATCMHAAAARVKFRPNRASFGPNQPRFERNWAHGLARARAPNHAPPLATIAWPIRATHLLHHWRSIPAPLRRSAIVAASRQAHAGLRCAQTVRLVIPCICGAGRSAATPALPVPARKMTTSKRGFAGGHFGPNVATFRPNQGRFHPKWHAPVGPAWVATGCSSASPWLRRQAGKAHAGHL